MLLLLPLFASLLEIIYYFNGSPTNTTRITTTTHRPVTIPVPVDDMRHGRLFKDKNRKGILPWKKNLTFDVLVTKLTLKMKNLTTTTTTEAVRTEETLEFHELVVVNEISSQEGLLHTEVPTEPKVKPKFVTLPPQLTNLGKIHREPVFAQLKKLNSLQNINNLGAKPSMDTPKNQIAKLQSMSLGRGSANLVAEQAATKDQLTKLKSLQLGRSFNITTEPPNEGQQFGKMKSLQRERLFDVITESTTSQEDQLSKLKSLQLEQSFSFKDTDLKKQEGQLSKLRFFQKSQSIIESTTQDEDQLIEVLGAKAATTSNVIGEEQIAKFEGSESEGWTPKAKVGDSIESLNSEEDESDEKSFEESDTPETTNRNPKYELEKLRKPSRTLLKDIKSGQEYGIQNNNNGYYLTVSENNGTDANGVYTVTGWLNEAYQKWAIIKRNNSYELISNSNGRNSITTGRNNQTRQWKIAVDDTDAFTFQLMNEDGNECIGSDGQLQISDCNNAFLWSFISNDQLLKPENPIFS